MPRPVFLAAPERGAAALSLIETIVREMQIVSGGALKGSNIFVPHIQAEGDQYFQKTLEALQECRVVIAVLDGPQADENVAFLLGYAFAAGKPVIGYVTDGRHKGAFVEGACAEMARDVRELGAALARALSA